MTHWEVFRWNDSDDESAAPMAWIEVGIWNSESSYSLGYDAAEAIGKRFGTGSYLFLNNEDERCRKITIAARQEFYEVEDVEPVTNESPIAEIMANEG